MTTPCVCGCQALDHHGYVGNCHGCTCSYFQHDDGTDGCPPATNYFAGKTDRYTGIYSRPYSLEPLDQETA
jgi:hypothetical protein